MGNTCIVLGLAGCVSDSLQNLWSEHPNERVVLERLSRGYYSPHLTGTWVLGESAGGGGETEMLLA